MSDEKRWASKEDLEATHEDYQMQNGTWVRVRFLPADEIAQQQYLPDLGVYTDLVLALRSKDEEKRNDVDTAELAVENIRYQARICHVAIYDPAASGEPGEPVPCPDCVDHRGQQVSHPPSLWSYERCRRLPQRDMTNVTSIALRSQVVGPFVPFSQAETPDDTPASVEPSESTPQPS